jgi:tRNA(Arg) A34 adenosine deaminase TadA
MERTLQLAAENAKSGGWPFAAVIVRDGKLLVEGVNSVHSSHDPSDHAEIAAIRRATAGIGSPDLSGSTMYVVGLPCPMCLACIIFSRIPAVTYAVDVPGKDAALTRLPPTDELYRLVGSGYGRSAVEYRHLDSYSDEGTKISRAWNEMKSL